MARTFTGVAASSYLEASDRADFDITGALTMACWFYRPTASSPTTNEGLIAKYQGAAENPNQRSYEIFANGSDEFGMAVSLNGTGADVNLVSTSTPISRDTWHWGVGRYNPSTRAEILVDDVSVGVDTTSIPASLHSGTAPLWIGKQFQSDFDGAAFEGRIGHVWLIPEYLSDGELKQLKYRSPGFRWTQGGYWEIGQGSPEPDWSGMGNNLTVTGAALADGPPIGPLFGADYEIGQNVATAVIEAVMVLGANAGMTASAQAIFETALTLTAAGGVSLSATMVAGAELAFPATGDLAFSSELLAEAAATLAAQTVLTTAATAQIQAAAALGAQSAVVVAGGQDVVAGIALAVQDGISTAAAISIEAAVALDTSAALAAAALADLDAATALGANAALTIVSEAVLLAGLSLDAIGNITIVGDVVSSEITAPDGRVIKVDAQIRTVAVPNQGRTITVN